MNRAMLKCSKKNRQILPFSLIFALSCIVLLTTIFKTEVHSSRKYYILNQQYVLNYKQEENFSKLCILMTNAWLICRRSKVEVKFIFMNQFNRIKVKRYEKWQINQNFWMYESISLNNEFMKTNPCHDFKLTQIIQMLWYYNRYKW